jgi:predicted RNA binding protein YcfA (HicA-like mRNA interferase family)
MVQSNYNYISGKKLIQLLDKSYGCEIITQKWSHIKIRVNQEKTIVPNHKTIAYGTFSKILKQLKIDEDSFLNLMNK